MTDITLNETGTITFTSGSPNLVGVGTLLSGLLIGDLVLAPDGHWYEIGDTPISNTAAVLNRNYGGGTVTNAVGGSDWVILKSSISRDSVRTATKQLTDITSLYRQILNLTSADQVVRLNKSSTTDRAGMIMQKAGVDLLQAGSFQDDDFSIRYLLATTWTKAIGVSSQTGALSLYSQLILGNTISPPTIRATTSNFAPAGIDKASVIRASTDADWTLTGLVGGVDGRVIALLNVGAQLLELETESGISDPSNRFALNSNLTVQPNSSALLIYDGAASRWRQLAGSGSGSGGVGQKGWSPILSYVANGSGGLVARISDWTGGEGAKPATGGYIGPTGLVTLASDAINVRGPKGDQIQFRLDLVRRYIQWSYVGTIDWVDLIAFDQITGPPTALEWTFSTVTADADPGAGGIALNSGSFGSITTLFVSKGYRTGTDASTFISTFDDSSSLPNRGTLVLIDTLDQTKVATFQVIGALVDAGTYFKVPVTPIGGTVFSNTRRISLLFLRTGDKGISGLIPRGNYSSSTSYLVGDVVDFNGSSYISLVQPNLNNALAFESTNASWALFARGVNQAFLDAINATLAASTAQASASATSAQLANDYAQKTTDYVVNTDNSSKAWAIGGSNNGQPVAGDAKSWAIKVTATVDGTLFSAKEYAQGTQATTGGSAKNWASQVGADVTGAAANSRSAKSWSQDSLIGATLGGSSKDWAQTTSATVDGVNFSAKELAQGSQAGTGGSAKNWAQLSGADVTGAAALSRSAKSWAQDTLIGATYGGSAKDWAINISGTIDGTLFSAREYAQGTQAATGGSAKNWATQIGADVTGAAALSRSSKSWAQDSLVGATYGGSAKDWASYMAATVDGTTYSAKYYATSVINAYTQVLTLEALVANEASASASNATSANSAATTATNQVALATAQATIATNQAAAAAAQVTAATDANTAAQQAKIDAAASATGAASSQTNAASSATVAAGSATAAQGYAAILANPDYGFFVDAPSDTRDYGSFV